MENIYWVTCTILSFVLGLVGIMLLWKIMVLLKEVLKAVEQHRSAIATEIRGLSDLIESRSRARTRQDKSSPEKYLGAQDKDRGRRS